MTDGDVSEIYNLIGIAPTLAQRTTPSSCEGAWLARLGGGSVMFWRL